MSITKKLKIQTLTSFSISHVDRLKLQYLVSSCITYQFIVSHANVTTLSGSDLNQINYFSTRPQLKHLLLTTLPYTLYRKVS